MNYLAHLYLSGDDDALRLGNFMGDSIKGNAYTNYPEKIQQGVLLHRAIDSYTDAHPIYKAHVRWLFPTHRHYSRVIVDVLYDHVLAVHWQRYHEDSLANYTQTFYAYATRHSALMPKTLHGRFDAMKKNNWLLGYADLKQLEVLLEQMSMRTRFPSQLHKSVAQLQANYTSFESDFFTFFSDIKTYTQKKLANL